MHFVELTDELNEFYDIDMKIFQRVMNGRHSIGRWMGCLSR
jgi:hypothetical protein